VLAGAGDTTMLAAGKNASYEILGLEARLVHWVADDTFPPLVPDIVLPAAADIRYDLRPYGLPGDVLPVAGHTAGSLVILLETGAALVGDLLRGGYLAGRLAPQRPVTHYFHEDLKSARSVLRDLVARGVHCFYVGHGGPLDGARVATWIDS
jgi:glyoxylase-like metal-dependent hydrolase (beta-lactamase superfamily II)